jgi:hypothetical protein
MARAIAIPSQPTPHEQILNEMSAVLEYIISAPPKEKYKLFLFAMTIYSIWLLPILGGSCHGLSKHF